MHALIANDFLCYARTSGSVWTAHCVDLDLAASGRTLAEAQARLERVIARHLENLPDADDCQIDSDRPVVWTVPHPMM